jgi:hypothetical protein
MENRNIIMTHKNSLEIKRITAKKKINHRTRLLFKNIINYNMAQEYNKRY